MANENQPQDHRIRNVDLTHTMRSSFLDYAMSVIVARALPDVRWSKACTTSYSLRNA